MNKSYSIATITSTNRWTLPQTCDINDGKMLPSYNKMYLKLTFVAVAVLYFRSWTRTKPTYKNICVVAGFSNQGLPESVSLTWLSIHSLWWTFTEVKIVRTNNTYLWRHTIIRTVDYFKESTVYSFVHEYMNFNLLLC